MPPAAGAVSSSNRVPIAIPATAHPAPVMISDAFAKDAIIAWFRGEFAAANAIIDALCKHMTQLEGGGGSDYESAFAAIHRRRLNWIPILQMQKFYPIADVAIELKAVAAKKVREREEQRTDGNQIEEMKVKSREISVEEEMDVAGNGGYDVVDEDSGRDESPKGEITDTGSQEVQPMFENHEICTNHEDCEARRPQIKITKGFVAKEPMKGHMVNVVKGLKLYHNIFTDIELSKLTDYVNELRVAGQNGELSVEGWKQERTDSAWSSNFEPIKVDAASQCTKGCIEPIPATLQSVIDHLIQWHLLSENRKPNSCIINFFDEGVYSQPFLKPPHLDQPISTLLLFESMALGHTLVCDTDGNYKGSLILSLKEGTLLVMRGNSADMARHVMCPSPNKRISITFFRVLTDTNKSTAMPRLTLWQPGVPNAYAYEPMDVLPKWGVLPMVLSPKRIPRDGTGVFLPWTVGSKRPAKHLPPRAQKERFLALPSPVETQNAEATSDIEMS